MYVVHVFTTKERRKFNQFGAAFAFFKLQMRAQRGVALWENDGIWEGVWRKVYATEGYPERLSRPWV
jgi:hypothetical protein